MSTPAESKPHRHAAYVPGLLRLMLRKGAGAFAVRSVGSVITFLSHLLLARLMGVEEYGLFVYSYTWLILLGVAAKWGMDKSMVRFGAPLLAQADRAPYHTLLSASLRSTLLFAVLIGSATLVALWLLAPSLAPRLLMCLALGTLWLPLLSAQRIHEGAAESMRNVMQATVPDYILRPALLGGFVVLHWAAAGTPPDAVTVVNYYTVTLALTVLVHRIWMQRVLPRQLAPRPAPGELKRWLTFGTHITLINNVSYALAQSDVLIIGALLSTTAAGIYSVAARLAAFAVFVSTAAFMVFSPVVAELFARGAQAELWRRTQQLRVRVLAASAAVSVSLAVAGPFVLGAFGESFVQASGPLYVLLAGYVVRSYYSLGLVLLNMTGNQRATLRILCVTACFNVALNVALLMTFADVIWAAVATAVSAGLNSWVLHRHAEQLFGQRGLATPQDASRGQNVT